MVVLEIGKAVRATEGVVVAVEEVEVVAVGDIQIMIGMIGEIMVESVSPVVDVTMMAMVAEVVVTTTDTMGEEDTAGEGVDMVAVLRRPHSSPLLWVSH